MSCPTCDRPTPCACADEALLMACLEKWEWLSIEQQATVGEIAGLIDSGVRISVELRAKLEAIVIGVHE